MPNYCSINSIPEFASLSKQRRREIIRQCHRADFKRHPIQEVLRRLAVTAPYVILISFHWAGVFVRISASLVWCAAAEFFLHQHRISRLVPEIRKRVGGYCVACGYDIRATPEKCPECGLTVPGNGRTGEA
jgi:hypothetical protein